MMWSTTVPRGAPRGTPACCALAGLMLLSSLTWAAGQRDQNAPTPRTLSVEAVQTEVLETTRKNAEVAIEQTRKTAEIAIDQTRSTAEHAIKAAEASNETIKTIFGGSALIIGGIVALGAFIGFREIQTIREGYKGRISQELDAFKQDLASALKQRADDAAAKVHHVTLMSNDIALATSDMARLKSATDDPTKEALAGVLLATLATIDRRASDAEGSAHTRMGHVAAGHYLLLRGGL